jgi:hypothetical protein
VPFQPTKAIIVGVDVLLTVRISQSILKSSLVSCDLWAFRPLSESVPVTTHLSTYLNVSETSSVVYGSTPRSHSPLRCPILLSRLWSKCFPCFPWQRTRLNRDASVSRSYVHNSDDLTFHREVCTEIVGRKRDRGRSAETGPPHGR